MEIKDKASSDNLTKPDKPNELPDYSLLRYLGTSIHDNSSKFGRAVRQLNMKTAIGLHNPERKTLITLRKENEERLSIGLEIFLDYFAQVMGIKDNSIGFMVGEIAQELMNIYYFYTLEEICFVLRKGVTGAYKNPQQFAKQSFDLETVLGWFRKYDTLERTPFVTREKSKEIEPETENNSRPFNIYENAAHNFQILNKMEKERKWEKYTQERDQARYQKVKANFFTERNKK